MNQNDQKEAEAYFLPATAKTFAGATFHPRDDLWEVWSGRGVLRFDFSDIPGMSERLMPPVKTVLSWYVQHRAPLHAYNMFYFTRHFFGEMLVQTGGSVASINNMHLMVYRDNLRDEREYYLSSLAGFLKKWHAFGHPGVEDSAVDYLSKVRLSGNRKGAAVLTMDPLEGPFTDLEFEAIHTSLTKAFRKADLGLEDYLATRLFMMLGSRPIQIAYLKVSDLNDKGAFEYLTDVLDGPTRGSIRLRAARAIAAAKIGRLKDAREDLNLIRSVEKSDGRSNGIETHILIAEGKCREAYELNNKSAPQEPSDWLVRAMILETLANDPTTMLAESIAMKNEALEIRAKYGPDISTF